MKKLLFLVLFLVVLPLSVPRTDAAFFDPGDPGTNIGTNLAPGFEPSGVLWHDRLQSLFVIWDNGSLVQMSVDGAILHAPVAVPGDLEGITVVDPQSNYIYLLNEFPQQMIEFDISTWTRTGRVWNFQGMNGDGTNGAEALTYNADTRLVYVGNQMDGQIYTYTIDFSAPAGNVPLGGMIRTGVNNDIAGLSFSRDTHRTYAVFDAANIIQEYDDSNVLVAQYDLPGIDQEGVTLLPGCPNDHASLIVAQDSGAVMKYRAYPITCPMENDPQPDPEPIPVNPPQPPTPPTPIRIIDSWSRVYDIRAMTASPSTGKKDSYFIFDAPQDAAYFKIPSQPRAGWYLFEVDARATSREVVSALGITVKSGFSTASQAQPITDTQWKRYSYYIFIPALTPTDVKITSTASGTDKTGVRREHHVRSVTVTRGVKQPFIPLLNQR